ncbi:hypothetical protein N7532_011667 [Penicillium argentinense]|uniref:CRAL-TRIO domain-containing protein n=1 Tax=Penicillium argentinense TaxID=1131581 RepID=A0A9W9EIX6_9EURO|nr:uncharacterized protein N7532_011667 [Penicillium argentinense]KAJ5082624.1 hypothetical protein N7532_011667 [Penicillium argentinense]
MASATETGYVGNLTSTQEVKLRNFWKILMQSWGANISAPTTGSNESAHSNGSAQLRPRLFSLSRAPTQPTENETAAIPAQFLSSLKELDAGPNELKSINALLLKLSGDRLRSTYLTVLKQDHPDALLLRFLRAEKWDVPKAWIKFIAALDWRVNEFKVDEEVMLKGEGHNFEKSKLTDNSDEKKDGEGFMLQAYTGKGFFHGKDKYDRPICVVRVRLHDPSTATKKGLNDYIIHCIETVRFLQVPPVETMTIVFDLTSFSLSNWDFPPVKFIIDIFQESYPESLGAMIFYNAPWIFSGFWKLIRGILDPVVAAKVHFISGAKDLEQIIPEDQIIKELGGKEDWDYKYIEPEASENARLLDTETRSTLLAEREKLGGELFTFTSNLIANPKDDTSLKRREEVIKKLRENYWTLDPYIRARSLLDRTGVIQSNGKVDFYPPVKAPAATETQAPVTNEKVDTTTEQVSEPPLTAAAS